MNLSTTLTLAKFIFQTLVSPSSHWPCISFSYSLPPTHVMPSTAMHLKALSHMEGLLKTAFGHSDCFHGCSLSILIQKDLYLGIGLWGVSGVKVSGGLCILTLGKQLTGWSCSVGMQPPMDGRLKDWPGPYGKQLFSEDRWQGFLGSTCCCPENSPGSNLSKLGRCLWCSFSLSQLWSWRHILLAPRS